MSDRHQQRTNTPNIQSEDESLCKARQIPERGNGTLTPRIVESRRASCRICFFVQYIHLSIRERLCVVKGLRMRVVVAGIDG